jgi:hypothetical protein
MAKKEKSIRLYATVALNSACKIHSFLGKEAMNGVKVVNHHIAVHLYKFKVWLNFCKGIKAKFI